MSRIVGPLACVCFALLCQPDRAAAQLPPPAKTPVLDAHGDPLPAGAIARLGTTQLSQRAKIGACAVSEDGAMVASAESTLFDEDVLPPKIRIWDAGSGKLLSIITFPEENSVTCLTFSPDGKKLAAGTEGTLFLFDPSNGKQVCALKGHDGYVCRTQFSADEKTIFTTDGLHPNQATACSVRQWDLAAGKQIRVWKSPQPEPLMANPKKGITGESRYNAELSLDGRLLVWSSVQGKGRPYMNECALFGKWRVIDTASGKTVLEIKQDLNETTAWLPSANPPPTAFSPDRKLLAVAAGQNIHIWQTHSAKKLKSLDCEATDLTFLPDSRTLLCQDKSGYLLFDAVTGEQGKRIYGQVGESDQRFYARMALSADGSTLVSVRGHKVRLFSVKTAAELAPYAGHRAKVESVRFSADGRLLTSVDNERACVWSTRLWKQLTTGPATKREAGFPALGPGHLVLSTDGKCAELPGDDPKVIHILDAATKKLIRKLPRPNILLGKWSRPKRMLFSPDGSLLALICDTVESPSLTPRYIARIWEVNTGKLVLNLNFDNHEGEHYWVEDCVISPDNRSLALLATTQKPFHAGRVDLWEIVSGSKRGGLRFSNAATCLALAPDGKTLATGHDNCTILIWDLQRPIGSRVADKSVPGAKSLAACWQALARPQAADADPALWAMVSSARDAVPFLKERLRAAEKVAPERIRQWISDLGSEKFNVRQKATHALEKCLDSALPALPALLEAAKKPPSVEVHLRLQKLIDQAQSPVLSPEQLRQVRAVEVLEHINNKEARQLLQALAQGAPAARLTQEARAALGRLKVKQSR